MKVSPAYFAQIHSSTRRSVSSRKQPCHVSILQCLELACDFAHSGASNTSILSPSPVESSERNAMPNLPIKKWLFNNILCTCMSPSCAKERYHLAAGKTQARKAEGLRLWMPLGSNVPIEAVDFGKASFAIEHLQSTCESDVSRNCGHYIEFSNAHLLMSRKEPEEDLPKDSQRYWTLSIIALYRRVHRMSITIEIANAKGMRM